MLEKFWLLFHTLRHLKFIQVYWRVYLKLLAYWPLSVGVKESIQSKKLALLASPSKHECLSKERFFFLNHSRPRTMPMVWNPEAIEKLWLYNLHYFDYLNQLDITRDIAFDLMRDWIAQNTPGEGCGWEPYPTALRIVNWIKFLSRTEISNSNDRNHFNQSLFLQARFLFRHLEYHLLGNHLFKNAVALIFAGAYFDGNEARIWLKKGRRILIQQIQEQILPDGGHFERSPMYHALILEDVLDCLNLNQAMPYLSTVDLIVLQNKAKSMLEFLIDIVHQDLEIPFFNDCALNIAPSPVQIVQYANVLGLPARSFEINEYTTPRVIEKSGFGLYVLENQSGRMIFDAGAIGPDYLPGHAHCDTLSVELSLAGHRCIVNSGTYQYAGPYRNVFRATKAHNTVQIDAAEQHEIWSTFRVARRGYPSAINVFKDRDSAGISASYTGYKNTKNQARLIRTIRCFTDAWVITDEIQGPSKHLAESYIHLHPDVQLSQESSSIVTGVIANRRFSITALNDCAFNVEAGFYAPEFGIKQNNVILVLRKQDFCPFKLSYQLKLL